jgi:prevent-host-death family protein
MDVGVRELKQRLSEYLDRVAQGERIRVTHRGRPKAMVVPLEDTAAIERGYDQGWLSRGEPSPAEPVPRVRARRRILDVLAEDRDERGDVLAEDRDERGDVLAEDRDERGDVLAEDRDERRDGR